MEDKILNLIKKAMTIEEIKVALNIENSTEFKKLVKTLNLLIDKANLVIVDDKYDLAVNNGYLKGILSINKKGFGFVAVENLTEDIYIPKNEKANGLHGDLVLVKISNYTKEGLRTEGKIVKILERNCKFLIGTFLMRSNIVKLDDKIFAPSVKINNNFVEAIDLHKVKVKITDYYNGKMEGDIVEIIGHINDPGIDILSLVYKHNFSPIFPKDVLEQVSRCTEVSENELQNRADLRDKMFITIDGADAKDLDDAVCLEKINGNYLLSVSIADVSHYVKEGSVLDKEALKRSTSVYLVDRVVPMLPHKLSNGICSLNPNVDRLTLTCEMEIDSSGKVINHRIYQSVINSKYRMTYENVSGILKGDKEIQNKYAEITHLFYQMNKLKKVLNKRRDSRGSINFETIEPKIIVDEKGFPTEIIIKERGESEKIIEEFMLVANETIAEHFHWLDLPFIYRVHEEPNQTKLRTLLRLTSTLGYHIKGTANGIHQTALQELLKEIENKPEAKVINTLMIRSMAKAKYSEQSLGHYGLATNFYTHFTSPIRRYPDLIVHRLIREYLVKEKVTALNIKHFDLLIPEIAVQTSKKERDAISCERDVVSLKMTEYMVDKVGEEFKSVVSSVTSFGIFVELDNGVEGLVHINDMKDDYYEFHQDRYILLGKRTKKMYTIGNIVKVRCLNANVNEARIDFEIVLKGAANKVTAKEGKNYAKGKRKRSHPKQKS